MHHHDDERPEAPGLWRAVLGAALAGVLLASPAFADRYVAVGGSDLANDCSISGAPCATIATAVTAAAPGEVVQVGAGTFAGAVVIDKALTLRGAQAGIATASRSAGNAAETIVDGRGSGRAIVVSSGSVVVEGLDVIGDALTHAGVAITADADLTTITIRDNFIHGMALASPDVPARHLALGVYASTGAQGDRKQLGGLAVQGNEIYALGTTGSVAGVAVYAATVVGATPGVGATISGNLFRTLATRDVAGDVGTGVLIDAGTDDFLGVATAPSSGVLVTGNTYVDSRAGAIVYAAVSTLSENGTSFANVPARVIDVGRLTGVDTVALGQHATSNALTGYTDTTGYFATIQAAVAASQPSAEVRPTAHVFAENVILTRGIQLIGPRAGEDARTRDPLLGEATVSGSVLIRAEGAQIDGITATNPGGVAIGADATAASATVRNVRVATAARGIALDRAQNATVTQNLVRDITAEGITAGSDAGTPSSSDDVASVALIQDNEVVNARTGVSGYLQFSLVSRNVFRDFPALDLGAGVAGALIHSVVEQNTVSGYTRGAGLLLTGNPNRPLSHDTTFRCNSFLDSFFGILIEVTQTTAQGILVRGNTISGNSIGALNYPPFLLDASNNWWGCAGGPGTAGCDVAGQNVSFAPFLTAVPDCATCAVQSDCDDGLFCNGSETCDPVITQCLPGTAPTCSLGTADPQCNVATCDQTFGCVAIPVSDGTTCDLGTPCSVVDSCVSGVCVAGPGSADDDGDGICNADDTCAGCDFALSIEKARVVRDSGRARKNGKIVVKGSFVAPLGSPNAFDTSGPISVLVRDGGSLSFNAPFLLAECKTRRNIITCKSGDRRFNLRVKPFRPRDTTGVQILNITLKSLDIGPTFQGPLSVLLRHGAGISRSGSIDSCETSPGLLRCF